MKKYTVVLKIDAYLHLDDISANSKAEAVEEAKDIFSNMRIFDSTSDVTFGDEREVILSEEEE